MIKNTHVWGSILAGIVWVGIANGNLPPKIEILDHYKIVTLPQTRNQDGTFTSDGQQFLSVEKQGIKVWNIADGSLIKQIEDDEVKTNNITAITCPPLGNTYAILEKKIPQKLYLAIQYSIWRTPHTH